MTEQIEEFVGELEGVKSVSSEMVFTPAWSPEKMSEDALRLINDEDLRRAFGEKGCELALQRYGSDKIIPQYIAFYEKIVEKAQKAVA